MSIDEVIRGAAEDLGSTTSRDVDPDMMLRSLQRTRSRRRLASSAVAACAVVCLSFGAWTAARDLLNPQSAPASPVGPAPTEQVLPGRGLANVAIPAGTYAVVVEGSQSPGQPMPVIDVPAGFTGGGFAVSTGLGERGTAAGTAVAPDARGLAFWEVKSVFTNPCATGKSSKDVGPSVADLARALAAQPLRSGSDPVPVKVAGYRGLYVETSVPAAIDFTRCKDGSFDSWTSTSGDPRFQQGPGQQDRLWILNVDGYRLVIDGWHMPGATPQQVDQITQMVKTLSFQTTN
jgi:hypothetical protein